MAERFVGLVHAVFTPMAGDGGLKLELVESYAERLLADGAVGVFAGGTSGESLSLTTQERLDAARRWVEVGGKDLPVIVHVGGNCLAECKVLAAAAQEMGAKAIACMAPCFFKPASVDDLVEFCRQVAAAAPKLGFYYYHIPSMTGVGFSMFEFLSAAAKRIETLAGMKFTYEGLADYARCVSLMEGRFDMLFGRDEMLLGALGLGARGAVGTTYNFMAPLFGRLMGAFRRADMNAARAEQLRAVEVAACLRRHGDLPAFKAVMKMLGIDCGPVRLPLRSLSDEEFKNVRREMEVMGFFDWR